ncbi:MAG: hypothetical protein J5669_06315 [Bacteroidales bacterium]|nr:hypothetical protein [Bacteroidales bacterium]
MKKNLFISGLMLMAALTLTNCAKQEVLVESNDIDTPATQTVEEPVAPAGVPFELTVGIDTKTSTTDASTISWSDADSLNVFHAVAGSDTYSDNDKFTLTSGSTFNGTLQNGALTEESYDWYVLYPYSSYIKAPNTNKGYLGIGSAGANVNQEQTGNNSKAHLAGQYFPLYGKATSVAAGTKPSITLKQALAVIRVRVKNANTEPLTVTSVSFSAPSATKIVGTFYINFAGDTPVFTPSGNSYVSNVANLTVNGGTGIAQNKTADFYIAVKPFIAAIGDKLTISVNGYAKNVTISSADISFEAGKINSVGFTYDYDGSTPEPVDYVTLPWESAEEGDGVTTSALDGIDGVDVTSGGDYGSGPNWIKFSDSAHNIVIKTDSAIGSVSVDTKANGSGSSLVFSESADGSTWSEVQTIAISTNVLSTTNAFADESRYVKIGFTKVSGSNAGIGRIAISKPNTDPVILANNISSVPAVGVDAEEATYTAKNFVDDVEVAEVDGAIVTEAIAAGGTIVYSVGPNYTTTNRNGTITLWSSSNHEITKTITVTQLKSTLSVSKLEVIIPADETTATFTVTTAEFGYTAAVASTEEGKNLSISAGATGPASAEAQTVTVSSTTVAPTEGDAITLGTISVYRKEGDTQAKIITIKKAVAKSGSTSEWATTETSNVAMAGVENGSDAKVNGYDAIKLGTSKLGGSMKVTVPSGSTKLHIHAAAWKGVNGLSLNISGATVSPTSINLTADDGISNNSPFTLAGDPEDFYFEITLSNITAATEITFATSTGKRCVIWGCNAE